MAGLGALLGGYGSDEDEDMEQHGDASPADSPLLAGALTASPAHNEQAPATKPQQQQPTAAVAAASPSSIAADSDTDTQGRQPLRVIDGPSTNPEPLPEGLSPPRAHEGLNGTGVEGSAGVDEQTAEAGNVDPKLLLLPPELREPPPGAVHPHVTAKVDEVLKAQQKSGRDLLSALRNNQRWNNPSFLEKMVDYYHLDQYGTSLAPEVWDPKAIPEEDYWPSLAQQLAAKKRQRGEQVRFTSAGQQQQPGVAAAVSSAAAAAAAAVMAMGQVPGAGGAAVAPRMLPPDPRIEAAQAQAAAVAKQLVKKSKWDK